MNYLVDTNVLVRALLPSDSNSGLARKALSAVIRNGDTLVIIPQIVAELWAVATRPEQENGLGYSPRGVERLLLRYQEHFQMRFETEAVYEAWRGLVASKKVRGKQTHDSRIAAAVLAHGIDRLLTFKTRDFQRFDDVAVVHPKDFVTE